VLAGEGIAAALSVPVELDGSPIGTLDIYSSMPWDWDDSEIAAAQAYAGVVASLFAAAVTAQAKSRLADQLRAALEHWWLIEQAKEMLMGRERLDAQAAFERLPRTARPQPGPSHGSEFPHGSIQVPTADDSEGPQTTGQLTPMSTGAC
jgi:GAF domain-containing protein